MIKNISKLGFFLFLTLIISTGINAQSGIKKMIKRSLNEKLAIKLTDKEPFINKNFDEEKAKLEFRNSEFGERLVNDDESGSESELFAAINPKDSNNIVVGVIHFNYSQFSSKPLTISIYYTNDFGNTWAKSEFDGVIDDSAAPIGGGDPVFVFDNQGNLHLTYLLLTTNDFVTLKSKEYLFHAVSKDKGISWKVNTYFTSRLFNVFTFEGIDKFLDKQWMVADMTNSPYSGNIYMGYVDLNIEDTLVNMFVNVIKPEDTTFVNDPVKVSSDSFKFVQYASIDINNSGDLYLGFVGSYDSIVYSFYNSVSFDGGKTFSEPRKISDFYFPGFTAGSRKSGIVGVQSRYFPSPYIAVDKSEGINENRIYATWTSPGIDKFAATGSDIFLSYSDDGGEVWSTPIAVNNDSLLNSDQFYSSLEVNSKGIPILCFYDKRKDSLNYNTDYYITYSLDLNNLDFSTQYSMTKEPSDFSKIGDKTNGFGIGEYNKTVSTGSFAVPFWSDGRKNTGDVNVYMALIPLDGEEHSVGVKNISLLSNKLSVESIAPNPNPGIFELDFTLKNNSKISFEVYDNSGKVVYRRGDRKFDLGKHKESFDLTNLKNGLYIISIKSDWGIFSEKIIIE